jgi:hypothetical protein
VSRDSFLATYDSYIFIPFFVYFNRLFNFSTSNNSEETHEASDEAITAVDLVQAIWTYDQMTQTNISIITTTAHQVDLITAEIAKRK